MDREDMPEIIIAHQTVTDGDAIGHDILGMYDILTQLGYKVNIFAENYLGKAKSYNVNVAKINELSESNDNILIYHHSIFWENGEKLLLKFRGKIIFKYHNITPYDYFKNYSDTHYARCYQGIEQTKRLIQKYGECIWWGDSTYNIQNLQDLGLDIKLCLVVPPFNVLDELGTIEPNFEIIESLVNNKSNNVLFVGRVAPNKGHKHLVETINVYRQMYGSAIHLWVVGSLDHNDSKSYNNEIINLVNKYGLTKNITLTDKLPIEDIKAYYLACDSFLCMSEHEGFCVPIIEAQKLMLPLVTFGGSALTETVGQNQIIINSFDYDFAASALFTIFSDKHVNKFCIHHGLVNVNSRFSKETIKSTFVSSFNKSLGADT
jgi:glycosyltransferase involved in cell wall biosynthesis